jgi:MSHA pilin protein MshD
MRCKPNVTSYLKSSGFTLIELVIGIVVLSISFTIIFSMIAPAATQSAQQVNQIRASELGQSMLNEIMGKAFDDKSDMSSGALRCGEDINLDGNIDLEDACSTDMSYEPDETHEGTGNRVLFDDVDDYNGLNTFENSLGGPLSDLYSGFSVFVEVCNDSQYDGICSNGGDNQTAKFITITVTTPSENSVTFSSYKANF